MAGFGECFAGEEALVHGAHVQCTSIRAPGVSEPGRWHVVEKADCGWMLEAAVNSRLNG